jgi:formate hydrogenlyase subunit 6/NADH:ubiquinone oxidoreductase subunit I
MWDAVGRKCFSCGSCNLVCPTCYCFNVKDEVAPDLAGGERKRTWDSCQLAEFATVAGGENFRKDRSARLRHRFFRKGKWIMERYGRLGCVGCGRCDRNCLVKINSVDIYTQLAGERVK